MHINLFRRLNAIGMLLVSVVLLSAFYGQLVEGELPCPLCLLQRGCLCSGALRFDVECD